MVSRAVESAQKRVEGNNFDARKRILEYDEVLRKQREIIYNERNSIIDEEDSSQVVDAMLRSTLQRSINYYINTADDEPEYQPFIDYINDISYKKVTLQRMISKVKMLKIFSKSFGLRLKQHIKVKKIS